MRRGWCDMNDDVASFDTINQVQLPCGCSFLLAWQEHRIESAGQLHDLYGVLDYLGRDHPERTYRIVTQDQAEQVVTDRHAHAHPLVPTFTISPGEQPPHGLCPEHKDMGYGADTWGKLTG